VPYQLQAGSSEIRARAKVIEQVRPKMFEKDWPGSCSITTSNSHINFAKMRKETGVCDVVIIGCPEHNIEASKALFGTQPGERPRS
jgi:hypothetical protein